MKKAKPTPETVLKVVNTKLPNGKTKPFSRSLVPVKKVSPVTVKPKTDTTEKPTITPDVVEPTEVTKTGRKHYVSNKDLLAAILQYKKDQRTNKREKKTPPKIPEY